MIYLDKTIYLLRVILWKAFSVVVSLLYKSKGIQVGYCVNFVGFPIIRARKSSTIILGNGIVLISNSKFTSLGVRERVILRTLTKNAKLEIGADCGLSGATICCAKNIWIGERCLIGSDVLITDTDFHPVEVVNRRFLSIPLPTPGDDVVIGNDVFIGARAIILKGVRIGDGSVIGAGSVVTGDLPPNSISAGNPARVIRFI
jgi:acetyltransferase-like isoleucine patch superfamily enzyme